MAKKSKYRPKGAPDASRMEALLAGLAAGTLESLSDPELAALAKDLGKREEVDGLLHLSRVASGKPQRKAVNRELYRLKQRGLAVPDLRERPEPISLGSGIDPSELPTLVGEPFKNGGRLVMGVLNVAGRLTLLTLRFEEPTGLVELSARPTSAAAFNLISKQALKALVFEGVSAVQLSPPVLLARKVWEAARLIDAGRFGPEVDRALLRGLVPEEEPPHPSEQLDLSDVDPMTTAEAADQTRLIATFLSGPAWDRMTARLDDLIAEELSEDDQTTRLIELKGAAVQQSVEAWNLFSMRELFLDAAFYQALAGNKAAARLLRDVVSGVEDGALRERVAEFLIQIV
jgi:hypothetical protein